MQLNVMPLNELLTTANNYATSIKELGIYSDLVKELCIRLEAGSIARREMTKQRDALAAESASLNSERLAWAELYADEMGDPDILDKAKAFKAQATDAFLREVRAQARKDGAHFVANRMLAAWDAGFIEDTAKNAADIARMILTSTEFMADAPEGDFDRSFADGVLADIAAELRKGGAA